MMEKTLLLTQVRWKLLIIWFALGGIATVVLVLQSLIGVYGEKVQTVWSWFIPNLFPTLALMVSVFAADAMGPEKSTSCMVRKTFYYISLWLSLFYLLMLFVSIMSPPLIGHFQGSQVNRLKLLETSNLWLGPLQSLVVAALGVLFFLKKDAEDIKGDEK